MEDFGNKRNVLCGSWIRRPENLNLVLLGKSRIKQNGGLSSSPAVLEIFSYDSKTVSLSSTPLVSYELEEDDGDPVTVGAHPNGVDFACCTTTGVCKFFEFCTEETNVKLLLKDVPILRDIGLQKCIAYSVDGSRFATGGVDGYLRVMEWPSLNLILDERKAHKSIRDMDFSLDTKFLVSTSIDGLARIWNLEDCVPQTTLTRKSNETIELCRFSKDGMKPLLFCAVQRGDKSITVVYDISTWNRLGYKKLLSKAPYIMSVSSDGKYLALGSKDGDISVTEVKSMEVKQYSKRLHPGYCFDALEFCPNQRVVLTTSKEWGAMVSNLSVPAEWKEWQIYLILAGLFLASAVAFYIFFQNSDSFWNFPVEEAQPSANRMYSVAQDRQAPEDEFGPVDL